MIPTPEPELLVQIFGWKVKLKITPGGQQAWKNNQGGRRASDKVREAGIDVMNHDSLEEIQGIYSLYSFILFSAAYVLSHVL